MKYILKDENSKEYMRFHLELVYDESDIDEYKKVLEKYGNVIYGDTISRDIIIPLDIPLLTLNYAIQKCFGWQNSHLYCFELAKDQFNNNFFNYCTLVGVVFRTPWMDEDSCFWQDDYESGSFKMRLKSKYKGLYHNRCHEEGLLKANMIYIK